MVFSQLEADLPQLLPCIDEVLGELLDEFVTIFLVFLTVGFWSVLGFVVELLELLFRFVNFFLELLFFIEEEEVCFLL